MAISADVLLKIMAQTGGSEEAINRVKKQLEDLGHTSEKTAKQTRDLNKASEEAGSSIEKTGKKTSEAARESEGLFGVLNQIRIGLTQLGRGDIGGLPNLIKAFQRFNALAAEGQGQVIRMVGTFAGVGVAAGGVAATIYGIVRATEAMIDVAEQVGTRSRKDFEKLDETFKAIGVQITAMDRAISQELMRSLDQLKAAFDSIFLVMLRESGPAMILFFRRLAQILKDMQPAAQALGASLRGFFLDMTAMMTSFDDISKGMIDELLKKGFSFAGAIRRIFQYNLKQVYAEAKQLNIADAAFDPKKEKKAKDQTDKFFKDLQARFAENAKLRLQTTLQIIEGERKAVIEAAGRGEISREQAEERLYDLKRRQIEALDEELLIRLRLSGVKRDDLSEENALLESNLALVENSVKAADEEAKAVNKVQQEILKRRNARIAELDAISKEIELLQKRKDLLVIPQAPPILGGQGGAPIPGIPAISQTTSVFDSITEALKNSGVAFTTWGDFASRAIQGVASATQDLLANFILTGQGGARAFKALAAGVIASLAVEAGVRAIMELAAGLSNTAKAAAAATNPFTAWQVPFFTAAATANFAAAKTYGLIAGGAAIAGVAIGAAGGLEGGGGGGGAGSVGGATALPAPVTINQGGSTAGFLGLRPDIVLQADLMNRQVAALETFNAKFNAASPEAVIIAGSNNRPDVIAAATLEHQRRDSGFSREFLSNAGVG